MRTGITNSWMPPAILLAAVSGMSGAATMASAALGGYAWLHPAVLATAVAQAAWLCWVSMEVRLVCPDERPAAWRRRDAVRMAAAAALSAATVASALLAPRLAVRDDHAVALCVAAGFAACTGACSAARLCIALRAWRKRRARRARKAERASPAAATAGAGGDA